MRVIASTMLCVALLMGMSSLSLARELKPGMEVTFCHGTGGWVPYDFFRMENGEKTRESIGYSIDVLNEILNEHGLKLKSHYYPWKRCLLKVKQGEIDLVLSATYSEERSKDYLLSIPYYSLTPNFFYMKSKYPQGISIASSEELFQYRMCGLLGYNYENFGIPNDRVLMSVTSFKALMAQLESGRCDVVLARYEPLAGRAMIGERYFDNRIQKAAIPNVNQEPFLILISRETSHAYELKGIIDDGIDRLRRQGRLEEILDKYLQ